ncbi:MAG: DotI/IcmL family type IV secretion protein [Colwellia sp.]
MNSKTSVQGPKKTAAPLKGPVNSKGKDKKSSKKESKKTKSPSLMADQIMSLTQDLDPASQALLHRFSLRLTAVVATSSAKWLALTCLLLVIGIISMFFISSSNIRIITLDAYGRVASVNTRDADKIRFSDSQIQNWANDTIIESFDFSFQNFTRRMERITNERYTAYGKSQFQAAIQPLIADIQRLQGIVYAESNGPAQITNIKNTSNGKIWTVTKPVLLTLSPTNGKTIRNKRNITLTIYQVNEWESLKGLAVNQVVQGS